MSLKDITDVAIKIMHEQLLLHEKESAIDKLKLSEVKSVTDIAKTLVMIDRNTKENPDDPTTLDNLTDEEIRAKAREIMEKYKK